MGKHKIMQPSNLVPQTCHANICWKAVSVKLQHQHLLNQSMYCEVVDTTFKRSAHKFGGTFSEISPKNERKKNYQETNTHVNASMS